MMAKFVDVMWDYAFRGKVGNAELSSEDKAIFSAANKIRDDLERYNSRAYFDNRNLEDILSLLSFEALAGGDPQAAAYETFVRAVTRTIELSSLFKYYEWPHGVPPTHQSYYHTFWNLILGAGGLFSNNLPALVTFNYDLVLERTLWEYFHYPNNIRNDLKPAIGSCGLKYSFGMYECSIRGVPKMYSIQRARGHAAECPGQGAEFLFGNETEVSIPYLKLHGSLNWSKDNLSGRPTRLPIEAIDKPLILPPVFNKMSLAEINVVWKAALDVLRSAVNIIIVGYSLPQTDIYMQYFLKAAVGPNSNLQRIIVFDPVLFLGGEKCDAMKLRYEQCFSPQFSSRIAFNPPTATGAYGPSDGKLAHFVWLMGHRPQELFFYA